MQKKFFIAAIILYLAVAVAAGFYMYRKPRANVEDIKPAFTLSAAELYSAFKRDEKKANERFLKKVIQVKGAVDNMQVTDSAISLLLQSGDDMGGVNCLVRREKVAKQSPPLNGSVISVKGKCVGFLMDVNIVDAVIVP